ncbi:hypothetical protein Zm00014a_032409 [Zea mays]|uniref:Uncharacterized protein n=1 Tax=Zea mays TaxID=4577 RepID=A0A317YA67_MAIZE|nr:hypothetical protein Zm00014a_032409 [Zea mays]
MSLVILSITKAKKDKGSKRIVNRVLF